MIAIFSASCYRQSRGFSVEAQREAVRRYLVSHHGEQIAVFVEWKAANAATDRSMPPLWRWPRGARPTLLVAKLDRLSRSVAFISALMDSRGFDLAIADMPGANRLTLHVLAAAAEHERHMIGERTRHALAVAKARSIELGNPKQAEIHRAKAAEQAQALRPHICCGGVGPPGAT
jgi:hypothetical protein